MIMPKNIDLGDSKKIVVIGEAGSGKTELSLSLAFALCTQETKNISVFDMDQTKPLFRLRDVSHLLIERGIHLFMGEQLMDSPIVPAGVEVALTNPETYVVMDIGGSQSGALCLGQYQELLQEAKPHVFYTINPYRCFSDTPERIKTTMDAILSYCKLDNFWILCNPYCGVSNDAGMLEEGAERLRQALGPLGLTWEAIMIPENLWKQTNHRYEKCIYIHPFLSQVLDID